MPKRLTKEEFIEKARKIHGDKFDYSKVEYVNNSTKVCIICPIHGEFWQKPNGHLNGHGCPNCNGGVKIDKNTFIKKAKEIHGDKYDYSKVEYVNTDTKVCIICPIHGEFWQTPHAHSGVMKCGCPKCCFSINDKDEFIKKAKEINGDKYDYSKVEYVNMNTKICIICPIHGEFWQNPIKHLNGSQCKKCKTDETKTKLNVFLEKARKIHGEKYDYSLVKDELLTSYTEIEIICPIHGIFKQKVINHLSGNGCYNCRNEKIGNLKRMTFEKFIEKARKIHGDKYDYSKVEYVNTDTKVCIICPIHGEFWQTPHLHLRGQNCILCCQSHLEEEMYLLLTNNNVEFEAQKRFDWLGRYSLDFYLPKHNIAIECQGSQHFEPIQFFGGETAFNKTIQRDKEKLLKCNENGIKIIYYSNMRLKENPYKFYTNKTILEKLKNENVIN